MSKNNSLTKASLNACSQKSFKRMIFIQNLRKLISFKVMMDGSEAMFLLI